ncbi:MAG: biopolymer transporter ExbD [Candidatus Marinimicrobia bacterium]|nr:biopolymer transporter ExbD [FCB group bacterium]MBL7025211.1 biopolymer transporter ExbD [Candidatus Neomarinimicrobiota bacterium]
MIFAVDFGPKLGLVFISDVELFGWQPDLPKAKKITTPQGRKHRVVIALREDSRLYVEKIDTPCDNLREELLTIMFYNPDCYAALYIDKDIAMEPVKEVLATLVDLGIRKVFFHTYADLSPQVSHREPTGRGDL